MLDVACVTCVIVSVFKRDMNGICDAIWGIDFLSYPCISSRRRRQPRLRRVGQHLMHQGVFIQNGSCLYTSNAGCIWWVSEAIFHLVLVVHVDVPST